MNYHDRVRRRTSLLRASWESALWLEQNRMPRILSDRQIVRPARAVAAASALPQDVSVGAEREQVVSAYSTCGLDRCWRARRPTTAAK
jgi:hypothetical protein